LAVGVTEEGQMVRGPRGVTRGRTGGGPFRRTFGGVGLEGAM
jgi:hypothetical protein